MASGPGVGPLGRSPRRVVGEVTGPRSRRRRKRFDVDALATATDASSMALLVCDYTLSRSMEVVDAGAFVGQGFNVATGCVTSGASGPWRQSHGTSLMAVE